MKVDEKKIENLISYFNMHKDNLNDYSYMFFLKSIVGNNINPGVAMKLLPIIAEGLKLSGELKLLNNYSYHFEDRKYFVGTDKFEFINFENNSSVFVFKDKYTSYFYDKNKPNQLLMLHSNEQNSEQFYRNGQCIKAFDSKEIGIKSLEMRSVYDDDGIEMQTSIIEKCSLGNDIVTNQPQSYVLETVISRDLNDIFSVSVEKNSYLNVGDAQKIQFNNKQEDLFLNWESWDTFTAGDLSCFYFRLNSMFGTGSFSRDKQISFDRMMEYYKKNKSTCSEAKMIVEALDRRFMSNNDPVKKRK